MADQKPQTRENATALVKTAVKGPPCARGSILTGRAPIPAETFKGKIRNNRCLTKSAK